MRHPEGGQICRRISGLSAWRRVWVCESWVWAALETMAVDEITRWAESDERGLEPSLVEFQHLMTRRGEANNRSRKYPAEQEKISLGEATAGGQERKLLRGQKKAKSR